VIKKEHMLVGCTEAQVETIILTLESLNSNADLALESLNSNAEIL
jgi:hypothetical protein